MRASFSIVNIIAYYIVSVIVILLVTQCNSQTDYDYSDNCESVNGEIGKCVLLKDCPVFYNFLRNRPVYKKNLRALVRYTCFFDLENPKVCCPPNRENFTFSPAEGWLSSSDQKTLNVSATTNNEDIIPSGIDNKSDEKGIELEEDYVEDLEDRFLPEDLPKPLLTQLSSHPNFELIPQLKDCSNTVKLDRLTGTFASHPWLALLGFKDKGTNQPRFQCLGVVINYRFILTSASCLHRYVIDTVRLGEYNLDTVEDCGTELLPCTVAKDYSIEKITMHEDFKGSNRVNDIALVRLTQNISFQTFNIRPVCLPFAKEMGISDKFQPYNDDKMINASVWTAGFGLGRQSKVMKLPKILQEKIQVIVPKTECEKLYDSVLFKMSDNQTCSGARDDICTFAPDAGSYILHPVKLTLHPSAIQTPKFFYLGTYSFGSNRCDTRRMSSSNVGVYTKTVSYLKWILDNIKS